MKNIIIILLLLIVSATSFSQQANSSLPYPDQDYMIKSKHQKTAALILLGGGGALTLTSIIIHKGDAIEPNNPNHGYKNDGIKGDLLLIWTLSMLTSVPLFIASSKNKKKGMSLSYKNEQVFLIQKYSLVHQAIPSLNLKINL